MRGQWRVHMVIGVALAALAGCHHEGEDVPLIERKISISDKFYDVKALSPDRAIVVGYGGKILSTENGGRSWEVIPSGTDRALYNIHFADAENGWISGQDGVLLHTIDGGKTWQRQFSGTSLYLFGISFINKSRGWAVGDRATMLETRDGGQNWSVHKLSQTATMTAEEAITSQDPVLYDVQFVDDQYGWVVGEFGKIFHSTDGGSTFKEQEESLLGAGIVEALDLPTFFGVHFVNRTDGLAAGLDGKIARTRDGGATWRFEPMDLEFPIIDPLFTALSLSNGGGIAVGAAGEVVRLEPGESKWKRAKLGMEVLTWLRGMYWLDENNGWIVGGYGLILHTKDGGKTWIPSLG